MKHIIFIFSVLSALMFSSCGDSGGTLTTVSGRPGDLLIVIDDEVWESEAGDTLKKIFSQDIIGIPWDEPLFDISRVSQRNFMSILKTARSIIDVEVSKTYTQPKVRYQKDIYAKTQLYVKIQLPNIASLQSVVEKEGDKMIGYFYKGERSRFIANFRKFNDEKLRKTVKDSTGVDMIIPVSFTRFKFKDDFAWMVAKNNDVMEYIAIYWTDYTSQDQLTRENLIAQRNKVMKENIPGSREGSYMTTGTFYPPVLSEFKINNNYVAELRGIWETDGDMMGGPFVSHSRVDEVNNRIVTVEAFVYAPHKDKRNYMRQLESLFYTIKFTGEKLGENGNKKIVENEEQ